MKNALILFSVLTLLLFLSAIVPVRVQTTKETQYVLLDTLALATVPCGSPLKTTAIRSPFGYRMHPVYSRMALHTGADLIARYGTAVHSTSVGLVTEIGYKSNGFGHYVVVKSDVYKIIYAHLSEVKVKLSTRVQPGELIAYTGNSGTSTGPHLHYEILLDNKPVNPVKYLYLAKK